MTRGNASTAWSWRHAVARSDLPAMTRHVLNVIALFMDEAGGSCFPSIDNIVEFSGLSRRAVLQHIDGACKAGWLRRQPHGFRGQRWKRNEYEPLWPGREIERDTPGADDSDDAGAPAEVAGLDGADGAEGGAGDAPPSDAEAVHVVHEGGAPDAPKVVHEVHQDRDQSIHHSKTSPVERERGRASGQAEHPGEAATGETDAASDGAGQPEGVTRPSRAEQLDADWQALKRVWPDIALEAHEACRSKLAGLKAAERRAAIEAVPAFIAYHREKRGKARLPYLVNYLGERRWEGLPKAPPAPAEGDTPVPVGAYDRAWWRLFFDWLERHGAAVGDLGGPAGQWLARKCSAARGGMPWIIQRGKLADLEERALRLIQVPSLGREADAWQAHLRARFGIDLPKPDRAEWIWVPAADPLAWQAGGWHDDAASGEDVR